jgi:polar amino acid transport system substrate-binding protein
MQDRLSAARSELAPTGTLRVALNMSNFLLTAKDPASGEPRGIAADLGRELGQRLGVPIVLLPYPNPGELADAASAGVWDVGFIGAEPQRAHAIDFTAAYVEIEATYLVPPGSPLQTIGDVDRPGVRIAAPARSAYELYLSRTLQHAQLIREQGAENTFKRFVEERLDALAGLRPRLVIDQEAMPGSCLLDGRFTAVQQAAGTPTGRPAGSQYLRTFIEDVKATGLVGRLIEQHHVRGLTVAAPA